MSYAISSFDEDPPVQGVGSQQDKKQIDIPAGSVGLLIGKDDGIVEQLQIMTGAGIQVTRDMDVDSSHTRRVDLSGTPAQILEAEQLIRDIVDKCYPLDDGGSHDSRTQFGTGHMIYITKVPNNKCRPLSEAIEGIHGRCNAYIQVKPMQLIPSYMTTKKIVQIYGTFEEIQIAKQLVDEVIRENRVRNPSMGGQYSQQGYQARASTSWAPPGPPMQQASYGFMQQLGAYPGQYNMPQPQYPGYPPQPEAAGGYSAGWDQTIGAPNQQSSQGDNSGFGYYQQPASGYNQQAQGYSQEDYGYGLPQTNPTQGYDQQQGYGSAPGYGPTPTPTATTGNPPSYGGAQGDTTNQAPPPAQPVSAGQQEYGTTAPQAVYGVPTSQAGYAPPSYGAPQY